MPLPFIRSSLDSILAMLLVVACGYLSFAAYGAVLVLERPKQIAFERIPAGTHKWGIFSGERCVGELQSDLKFEPGTVLIAQGQVRVRYKGVVTPIRYFSGSFFNVLDQLVASNFSLEGALGSVTLKLTNPNPIDLVLEVKQGERNVKREFQITGPVYLKKTGGSIYRVDYSALLGEFQQYTNRYQVLPFGEQSLEVVSDPESIAKCGADSNSAIELDSLVEHLQQTVAKLQSLLRLPGGDE